MLETEPERIFVAVRERRDPGLRAIDWDILRGIAAGQPDEVTARIIDRAVPTVRRRVSTLEKLLVDGLGVPPSRQLLVTWYHLHSDQDRRHSV